jgi:2-isopropylmalate synthase
MNLYTQGIDPGLDFSDIDGVRHVVERCNQIPVHPRHPYAGDLVFTAFSGSHQDAIRKGFAQREADTVWDVPYLPIDPADLGRSYDAVIRVNSQSGKGGATYLLERGLGFTPPRRVQIEFSHAVQKVADASGAEVSGEAICALFMREYFDAQGPASRDGSALDFDGRHVKLPVSAVADEAHAQAVATAVASMAGVAIEVASFETAATAKGETAVFIGCRIGDQAMRFGVAVNANASQAVADAIVSAVNRVRWAGRKEVESEAVEA